jgi:hypothetical protein
MIDFTVSKSWVAAGLNFNKFALRLTGGEVLVPAAR